MKHNDFEAEINGATYKNRDRFTDVSFSVRNVEHPKKAGRWNLSLKIRPSIHYERHYMVTDDTYLDMGVQKKYDDLKLRRLAGLGNLKFTIHTPLGAFATTAGFGGALSKLEMPGMPSHYKGTEIRKVDFVWYGFFAKRFFILMGPRYYKEKYEQVTFALRLGIFWGSI